MSHTDFIRDPIALSRADWWGEFHITAPDGSALILRFSRHGTRNKAAAISLNGGVDIIAAHQSWEARILTVPTITQSMWKEGSMLSSSLPTYGEWVLNNGNRFFDQYHPKEGYVWTGGRCKLFLFDRTDISGTIAKKLDGRLGNPQYSFTSELRIPVYGLEEEANQPLHSRVYRGTSYGLELVGGRAVDFGTAPAQVNLRNDLTIKGWLYLEALNAGQIVIWGLVGTSPWRLVINAARQLAMFVSIAGASESQASSKVLSARIPYHFGIVISGRDVIFYLWDDVNQVKTKEVFPNAFSVFTRDTTAAGVVYAFRTGSDATLKIWGDEFQVFNYAQTEAEIDEGRFRPLNANIPATCVHRVGFDDGTGTTVTDSSASGLHGTISGAGTDTWLWQMEGDSKLAGTPKPDTVGHKFGVKPVLVAPLHYCWQVHWGSTQSITSSEGGAPRTMSNAATLRDFIVNVPAAGNSLTFLSQGLFKMPSIAPSLPISAIVEGANDGFFGYESKASRVARYLVTKRGPMIAEPGGIDTASFTTFQGGFDPDVGFTVYESRKPREDEQNGKGLIKDSLDLVMRSALGWWGFTIPANLFHIEHYSGPALAPTYSYSPRTRSGYADVASGIIVSMEPINNPQIIYEVQVRYHFNDVVMSEEQVASTIKGTVSWSDWTKPYLTARAVDETLRSRYQGKGGKILIIESAVYEQSDAQRLANDILTRVKGQKEAYRATLQMVAANAIIGQTEVLEYRYQDGTIVMGLDGNDLFVIVTTVDKSQEGVIVHEVTT